jgi:GTP-binding protein
MFIDEAEIEVKAGDGGKGCCAFERSRRNPRGRPSGGSGGRGGDVMVRASSQLHTLRDCSYRRRYEAGRGVHGKGSNWTGADGRDATIEVPCGTIVQDRTTGRVLCDCVRDGEEHVVARGGRGGKGNQALMSHANPFPQNALAGQKGEQRTLRLTLKVLADVGLVGRPNAGKSTFLARISRARPAIADYPFTTKEPHLGIAALPGTYESIVVADIPGLIEDSHKGRGLGIRFLRHIERTRILALMVECTSDDPAADAEMLLGELRAYSPLLAEKPMCFLLTKVDLRPDVTPPPGWLALSSVTGQGVDDVLAEFRRTHASLAGPETPATGGDE